MASYALAGPAPVKMVECKVFDSATDTSTWREQGNLEVNPNKAGEWLSFKRIPRQRSQGMTSDSNYMYTLSAGVGWFESRAQLFSDFDQVYVKAERQYGKGLGQKFRYQFLSKDTTPIVLADLVLWANQECKMTSSFNRGEVSNVKIITDY